MAQEYDRTNTFVLFINDKKGNEKAPDRSGTINVDGVEYYMDGWLKEGQKGPFLSGKIKQKGESYKGGVRKEPPKDDGDIPF